MNENIKSDSIVKIISNNVDIDIFSPYKISSDGEGIGTGFFINNDGFILTCAHVVDGSIKLFINSPLEGKKRIPVVIHSICFEKDIALLKTIEYKNKDYCKIGNSDTLKTEANVLAIGYPLGQDRLKKTSGIVSGIQNRFIQTDAPINPGNSGGPLFDSDMNVIGINTAKMISLFAENIGFATPINDFLLIKQSMFNPPHNKIITEPNFYCEIQSATVNYYKLCKCPTQTGCIIKSLVKHSPMYEAGVRENDILLNFNNFDIDSDGDVNVKWSNDKVHFYDLKAKCLLDNIIPITYWSISKQQTITTEIKLSQDKLYKIKHIRYPFELFDYEIFAGMVIMDLTMNHLEEADSTNYSSSAINSLLSYKNIKLRTKRVVFVSNILQGSFLSSSDDIKSGSMIKSINGKKVKTLNDVRNQIKNNYLLIDGKKMIHIKFKDKNQIIIDIPNAFLEEELLSQRYKYTISKLY